MHKYVQRDIREAQKVIPSMASVVSLRLRHLLPSDCMEHERE